MVRLAEHTKNNRTQSRKMDGDNLPEPLIVKSLILVSQHIADANDCRPWRVGKTAKQFSRQGPRRLIAGPS